MSALATPLIYSNSTISGTSDMVNVDQVQSISKTTVNSISNGNTPAVYGIAFNMTGSSNVQTIVWKYETELARDEDYDSIADAVADEINPIS
ncbi:MAG: hypothetical protein ACK5B9_04515 [Flavobacteriia bacterium]|jgi:DMSO reductase anchor subunit